MKKPYSFDELSEETCSTSTCKTRLKLNVVTRKTSDSLTCYKCYRRFRIDQHNTEHRKYLKV